MNNDKLAICFNPWMIFHENEDFDEQILSIAERGFNCIRIEDGAGLLWDTKGKIRNDVLITAPFGRYTKYTTYKVLVDQKFLNLLERLLKICRAAKKYNVKVILSSWFFLHTNWFCEEKDKAWIFDLNTEQKISFFAEELGRILHVLKQENLIDVIAFAEIFNEFDGLPFAGEYEEIEADEAERLRKLHEKEIAKLKQQYPEIMFAFDSANADVREELIPRNADVWNFHCYYMWPAYQIFEKGLVCKSLEEIEIPDETGYYLKENIVSVKEVTSVIGNVRTGLDWPRRISLYASIDQNKEQELTMLLEQGMKDNIEQYRKEFRNSINTVLEKQKKIIPDSRLVMGEGGSYCASPTLPFERDSVYFWELLREQIEYLKEKETWGTVITTTHAPERNAAWEPCREQYIRLNEIFLK